MMPDNTPYREAADLGPASCGLLYWEDHRGNDVHSSCVHRQSTFLTTNYSLDYIKHVLDGTTWRLLLKHAGFLSGAQYLS